MDIISLVQHVWLVQPTVQLAHLAQCAPIVRKAIITMLCWQLAFSAARVVIHAQVPASAPRQVVLRDTSTRQDPARSAMVQAVTNVQLQTLVLQRAVQLATFSRHRQRRVLHAELDVTHARVLSSVWLGAVNLLTMPFHKQRVKLAVLAVILVPLPAV